MAATTPAATVAPPASMELAANKLLEGTQVASKEARSEHFKDWPTDAGWDAHDEQLTPRELPVSGAFPAWAAGTLLRTGPSARRTSPSLGNGKQFSLSHWFDGFSHLHKFQLEAQSGGPTRVHYQSRRQTDELMVHAQKTGRLDLVTFGQKRDPCDSLFKKLKSTWSSTAGLSVGEENVSIAIQPVLHKDMLKGSPNPDPSRVLTTVSDNSRIKSIDLDTLEPFGVVGQDTLHPALDGEISAAHSGHDTAAGEYFNFNLRLGPRPTYKVFRSRVATGTTDVLATLHGLDAAYLHSSFLTKNFFILCIWPAKFVVGGAKVLWKRNILDALKWDAGARTTWVVIDRNHGRGEVARFTTPPFFCFHSVNAWEQATPDGVDIVCDLSEHPDMDILYELYYENLMSSSSKAGAYLPQVSQTRYALPMTADGRAARRGASATCVARHPGVELPTLNPAFELRPHRFTYGITTHGCGSWADGLAKVDMRTGESTLWRVHGHTPGEAVFVADPAGGAEDDGVLLSVVLDGHAGRSYLLCLDARSMREQARADVGAAVGFGTHGAHLTSRVAN